MSDEMAAINRKYDTALKWRTPKRVFECTVRINYK